jgi:hypothetical protein
MIDAKTDLITTFLKCGSRDVDALIDIIDMGNELCDDNILANVIDEYGCEELYEFNTLIGSLMSAITYRLVREIEDGEMLEEILYNKWSGPYTNYMDSHFQIDCLDAWESGTDREQLLKNLEREILGMEKR